MKIGKNLMKIIFGAALGLGVVSCETKIEPNYTGQVNGNSVKVYQIRKDLVVEVTHAKDGSRWMFTDKGYDGGVDSVIMMGRNGLIQTYNMDDPVEKEKFRERALQYQKFVSAIGIYVKDLAYRAEMDKKR